MNIWDRCGYVSATEKERKQISEEECSQNEIIWKEWCQRVNLGWIWDIDGEKQKQAVSLERVKK